MLLLLVRSEIEGEKSRPGDSGIEGTTLKEKRAARVIEKALEQSGASPFAQTKEVWDIAGS